MKYPTEFFVPQIKDDHCALKYCRLSTRLNDVPPS
jgi:hypothetical protein